MDEPDSEVIVAAVALVISVIALFATVIQVLQQYYASARGYSLTSEKVMGEWAHTKSRVFIWEELRFEVQFDSPVIFVSPPTNRRGPIPNETIHFLTGTDDSLRKTWSVRDLDWRKEYERRSVKERIHTADNEHASWFVLMYAVQRMEHEAREWQETQYMELGPPPVEPEAFVRPRLPDAPPSLEADHTLTVALQKKRKSWDTMPPVVTKPYATTTMCHLIEMMAALGVYWKQLDRAHDRYRAEGNGFTMLGERLTDVGLMFSFKVYGQCQFKRTRVIPVDEIKELCFGYVPTVYRETLDRRRLKAPIDDESRDLRTLTLATRENLAETLGLIGCNMVSVNSVLDESKRISHLFPLSFEILGMLSKTFHISNSSFTYIPNPTPDRWDRVSQSLIKILESYRVHVEEDVPGVSRNSAIIKRIKDHADEILGLYYETKPSTRLYLLQALHMAVDDTDEILTAKARHLDPSEKPDNASETGSDTTHDLARQERRREEVQDVLRSHIQEVLRLLNETERSTHILQVPEQRGDLRGDLGGRSPSSAGSHIRFEDIDMASPDDRQEKFVEVYFSVIRRHVVPQARDVTVDRRASISATSVGLRRRALRSRASTAVAGAESAAAAAAAVTGAETGRDSPRDFNPRRRTSSAAESFVSIDAGGDGESVTAGRDGERNGEMRLAEERVSHDDLWCTLVFRMVCWLMLHDFDKGDVQLAKTELYGSRMPVYIA